MSKKEAERQRCACKCGCWNKGCHRAREQQFCWACAEGTHHKVGYDG